MKNRRRRLQPAGHHVERDYIRTVAMAMLMPTLLVTGCIYYLIWHTVAYELALPELIANALMPAFERVNKILIIGLPLIFLGILLVARTLSKRLAGPLDRLEAELDDMLVTKNFQKQLHIRRRDSLHPLFRRINQLLREIPDRRS